MNPRLVIDASHANCGKSHVRHATVLGDLARRIGTGERGIAGVTAESFLVDGTQKLAPGGTDGPLVYGQSVHGRVHGVGHHPGAAGRPGEGDS